MSNPYEHLKDRFWLKVQIGHDKDCWNWTGALKDKSKKNNQYGSFRVSRTKSEGAHRVAFILTNGPIPTGLFVCHSCDNPKCCNPSHLWLGTNGENMKDAFDKNRKTVPNNTGERHGLSKLTVIEVRQIKNEPRKHGYIPMLANKFNVSRSTISAIRNGTRWGHVV